MSFYFPQGCFHERATITQLTILFFKVKPGLGPQRLCAEMVSSIVWQGKILWLKETESNKKLCG